MTAPGRGAVGVVVETTDDGEVVLVTATREHSLLAGAALKRAGLRPQRSEGRLLLRSGALPRLEAGVPGLNLVLSPQASAELSNRAFAAQGRPRVADTLRQLRSGGAAEARAQLADVRLLDGLDDHQVVNVCALTTRGGHGFCLFDEQGAGKTVSLLAAFDVLVQRDEADVLLVLAPKAMLSEWCRDTERFFGGLYRAAPYTGSSLERRETLRGRPDVLVTNYDSVASHLNDLLAVVERHGRRTVLAVDESYHVKNAAAARSRAVRRLRRDAGRAVVLCGTPAPNRPQDVIAQVDLVDFGLTFEDVTVPRDRQSAVGVVRDALEDVPGHLRHLKADVLPDLPGKTFHQVRVELEPEQGMAYAAARDTLVEELRTIGDAAFAQDMTRFAARRSALLRLCSHPVGLLPGYDEVPGKLLALDRLLQDRVVDGGEKVVVWSFYTASLQAIADRYRHLGLVRYDGTVTDVATRRELVRGFQEDADVRLFLGNPAAAGAGLTLHAARTAVYESLSNQGAHYLQSLDRIHRRGQAQGVEYVLLVAADTVEEAEMARLLGKQRHARDLLQDRDEPPLTRQSLLEELLTPTPMTPRLSVP